MERRRFTREFKLEAVRLIRNRGVSYAQASQDLNVHPTQLRNWVKAFADDPQQAFPGQGQMKPEQLEIARLKREVIKLKAERSWAAGSPASTPPTICRPHAPGKSFVILESRDAIGGTWDLFRYPGIRSDSDMFTFGYPFRPWLERRHRRRPVDPQLYS
jgi:transposase